MSDQNCRTRTQHWKSSTSQTSEEDVLIKFRLGEDLDDEQVAAKLAKNNEIWEPGPPGWTVLITSRGQRDTKTEGGSRGSGRVWAAEQHSYLGHSGACPQGWWGRGHQQLWHSPTKSSRSTHPSNSVTSRLATDWGGPDMTRQRWWTKALIVVRFWFKNKGFRVISNRKQLKEYNLTAQYICPIYIYIYMRLWHQCELNPSLQSEPSTKRCFVFEHPWWRYNYGSIFRIAGPLCGEPIAHRWFRLARDVNCVFLVVLRYYLYYSSI